MKKSILLLVLLAFTYTASAALVHIRKDTEVCSFNKTGKPYCYYKKQKSYHHKPKQKHKLKITRHKKAHQKHKLKHHQCR